MVETWSSFSLCCSGIMYVMCPPVCCMCVCVFTYCVCVIDFMQKRNHNLGACFELRFLNSLDCLSICPSVSPSVSQCCWLQSFPAWLHGIFKGARKPIKYRNVALARRLPLSHSFPERKLGPRVWLKLAWLVLQWQCIQEQLSRVQRQ